MVMTLAIALIAGCAAALMFASVASDALLAVFLLMLAPLPLMVAALGWGPLSAVIGGLIGGIGVALSLGPDFAIVFLLGVATPALWLGHVILLAKPQVIANTPAHPTPLEWYPTGRILIWIAICASLLAAGYLLTLGKDDIAIYSALHSMIEKVFAAAGEGFQITDAQVDAIARAMPPAISSIIMFILLIDVWGAVKVVAASDRLKRPWPDMGMIELPRTTVIAACCAVALSFTGGLVGLFAQLAISTLSTAFAIVGLAVLHVLTRPLEKRLIGPLQLSVRGVLLFVTYASILTIGWPILAMTALGIADSIVGLRSRITAGRPPLPQPPRT